MNEAVWLTNRLHKFFMKRLINRLHMLILLAPEWVLDVVLLHDGDELSLSFLILTLDLLFVSALFLLENVLPHLLESLALIDQVDEFHFSIVVDVVGLGFNEFGDFGQLLV